ncbi:hypothetical protein [Acinetobacter bereziniae]|uniref:hypothetical protein n=1 Tax=Acinetobacter bereziniae TaxID=106648 RepID=UPI001250ABA4|nr:hypothetical protein [Acinetobacter bereziniae]
MKEISGNPTYFMENNGNTFHFCLRSNNIPEITCVGATNTVLLHRAVLINPNGSTIFPQGEKFIINGVEYDVPPDYIDAGPTILPPFPPPSGYKWVDSILIKNNAGFDVRFEHQMIPNNQNLARIILSDNPTVISLGENANGVCLSKRAEEIPGLDWAIISNVDRHELHINNVLVTARQFNESTMTYIDRMRNTLYDQYNVVLNYLGFTKGSSIVPSMYFRNESNQGLKIEFKKAGATSSTISNHPDSLNNTFMLINGDATFNLGSKYIEDPEYQIELQKNFFAYRDLNDSVNAEQGSDLVDVFVNEERIDIYKLTGEQNIFYKYLDILENTYKLKIMQNSFYGDNSLLNDPKTWVFENLSNNQIRLRISYLTYVGKDKISTALNDSISFTERNMYAVISPMDLVVDVENSSKQSINLRHEFVKKYPPELKQNISVKFNILSPLTPIQQPVEGRISDSEYVRSICEIDPIYSDYVHDKASGIFVGKVPAKMYRGDGNGEGLLEVSWNRDQWEQNVEINVVIQSSVYGLGGSGGNLINPLNLSKFTSDGQNGYPPICNFDDDVKLNVHVARTGKLISGGGGGAAIQTGFVNVLRRSRPIIGNTPPFSYGEWSEYTSIGNFWLIKLGGMGGCPNGWSGQQKIQYDANVSNTRNFKSKPSGFDNAFLYAIDFEHDQVTNTTFIYEKYEMVSTIIDTYKSGKPGQYAMRSLKSGAGTTDIPFLLPIIQENSGEYQYEYKRNVGDFRIVDAAGGLAGKLIRGRFNKITAEQGAEILSDDLDDLDIEYV